jgi:transcriptional regulator with XRE-family HTH domain
MIKLGETIRRVWLEKRWTQQNLARHLGICDDTLRHIELGRRGPKPALEKNIRDWLAFVSQKIPTH